MNDQFLGKNLIINLIIAVMALMMVVGLAIPVAVEYTYLSYPVYESYTKTFNGFNTLAGNEYLSNYASAVAAVNWILLILGIVCIVFAGIAIFNNSCQQKRKFKNIVAIAAFVSALLYMIEGIVMTALWYGGDSTTTISPVLFSIQLVLMIIYFVCNKKENSVKSNYTQNNSSYNQSQAVCSNYSSQQTNTNISSSVNESDKYEELLKYKKLFDMGAISKEEFEEKKKELL